MSKRISFIRPMVSLADPSRGTLNLKLEEQAPWAGALCEELQASHHHPAKNISYYQIYSIVVLK